MTMIPWQYLVLLVSLPFAMPQQLCKPSKSLDLLVFHANQSEVALNVSGHVYIGAILPVRERVRGSKCGNVTREGAMAVEAFTWAIRSHRHRTDSNCRLNAEIRGLVFDTCGDKTKMFRELNNFENCAVGFNASGPSAAVDHRKVLAYIGPHSSQLVYHSMYLFEHFDKVNLITSTGVPDLEKDAKSFHLFPSASSEVASMASFVNKHRWKYVVVVYSDDAFGRSAYIAFIKEAQTRNIHIIRSEKLVKNAETIKHVANQLKAYEDARILLCLAQNSQIDILWPFLRYNFIFITPSSYGFRVSDAIKSTSIRPESFAGLVSLIPDIYDHYKSEYADHLRRHFYRLNPSNTESETLQDYWQSRFNCRLPNSTAKSRIYNRMCDVKKEFDDLSSRIPADIVAIPQAVDALLMAAKAVSESLCAGEICERLFDKNEMVNHLPAKMRTAKLVDMKTRLFESASSGPQSSSLTVTQVQDVGSFRIVKMNSKSLLGESRRIKFYDDELNEVSITSSCPRGHAYCRGINGESEVTRNSSEYGLRFQFYGHGWDIAVAVIASLGILLALALLIVCIYYGYNGVIQFVFMRLTMLLGIICGYLTSYAFIVVPTPVTCGITRVGVGFSYAVCFSVLLLFSLRFSIKPRNMWNVEPSSILKYRLPQVILFLFALGAEVAILVFWLFTVRPKHVSATNNDNQFWMCNHYTGSSMQPIFWAALIRTDFINHVYALTYIMVIILVVFLISLWGVFKRKLGSTLDVFERRAVAFVLLLVILVWITWPLVGALHEDHMYAGEFSDASLAFGLLITLTILLVFFLVHIVVEIKSPDYQHMSFKDGDSSVHRSDSRSSHALSGQAVSSRPSPLQPNGRVSYIKVSDPADLSAADRITLDRSYRNGHLLRAGGRLSQTLPRQATEFQTTPKKSYHYAVPHQGSNKYSTPTSHQHQNNASCNDCGFDYDPTSLHLVHPRTSSLNTPPSQDTTFASSPSKLADTSFVTDRSSDYRAVRTMSEGLGTQFKGSRSAHGLASTYSSPNVHYVSPDTSYGTGRMLRVTRELVGSHPTVLVADRSFSDSDHTQRRRKIYRSKSEEKLGML